MSLSYAFALLVAFSLLAGCTNEIRSTIDIDDSIGLSIDAKQRLVLVTNEGGLNNTELVVCAKSNPDTVTTLAESGGIMGNGGGSFSFFFE